MGIMIRGRCSTCNRTGKLIDPENIYCSHKCGEPREIRRVNIKNLVGFLIWSITISSYIFWVCYPSHSLITSLVISIMCGIMTTAMMFAI